MAYRIDDRWLWLSAGVALFVAVKGISYAIHDTVRLTEVEPLTKDQDEDQKNQPEDSISLNVLRTLATSPNTNISKSALDLIAARSAKTKGLITSVQADAASSDPELRRKARTAMIFLSSWTLGGEIGNPVPPGMRTGGSTGALNLSPSMLSVDSAYEFDGGNPPPSRLRLHQYGREATFGPLEGGTAAAWAVASRERGPLVETEVRRRRREAMVLHDGSGELGEEDIIRPRAT